MSEMLNALAIAVAMGEDYYKNGTFKMSMATLNDFAADEEVRKRMTCVTYGDISVYTLAEKPVEIDNYMEKGTFLYGRPLNGCYITKGKRGWKTRWRALWKKSKP